MIRRIAPPRLGHPFLLVLTAIIPQALLIAVNVRSFRIVWADMEPESRAMAFGVLLGELLVIAAVSAVAWRGGGSQRSLSRPVAGALLSAFVALLWGATAAIMHNVVPQASALWILPPQRALYYFYALTMPAVFHLVLFLALFPVRVGVGKDALVSGAVAVGVSIGWFLLFRVGMELAHQMDAAWLFMPVTIAILGVVGGLATVGAVLRLCAIGLSELSSMGGIPYTILVVIVGIAAPVGGLLLNHWIGFPADFQAWSIYALAILNGVALAWPATKAGGVGEAAVGLARAALFPFTLYFFVVFLPFLPLALPAMIAWGAGFLVLTPTILMVVHLERLAAGFRSMRVAMGRGVAISAATGAILLLPALFIGGAVADRIALREAADRVFHANPLDPQPFTGNRAAVRRSLRRMQEARESLHLPFMSPIYDRIVFDGLVMPEEKFATIHRVLFGASPPEMDSSKGLFSPIAGRRRAGILDDTTSRGRPPHREVRLDDVAVTAGPEAEGAVRRRYELTMTNPTDDEGEYVVAVEFDRAALVSGFELDVEGTMVPGRLFEKKTALWVYRTIRDTVRRDPGLVTWTEPGRLELRVYPFAPGETRRAALEILSPVGVAGYARIGDREFAAGSPDDPPRTGIARADLPGGGAAVVLTAAGRARLPSVRRERWLHFVIDGSVGATGGTLAEAEEILARCRAVAERFPNAAGHAVWVVGDSIHRPYGDGILPRDETLAPSLLADVERRGGFCRDRAISSVLATSATRAASRWGEEQAALRYPTVIVLPCGGDPVPTGEDLRAFARRYAPEAGGWWRAGVGEDDPILCPFARGAADEPSTPAGGTGGPSEGARDVASEVILLRSPDGGGVVPVSAGGRGIEVVFVRSVTAAGNRGIEVFDPDHAAFVSVDSNAVFAPTTAYARGMGAWALHEQAMLNPSRTAELLPQTLDAARAASALVPANALIVVENAAQWAMLEETERRKLAAHEDLELDVIPEPGIGGLLAAAAAGWWLRRRRAARPRYSPS